MRVAQEDWRQAARAAINLVARFNNSERI
jgi:hypothetical protein